MRKWAFLTFFGLIFFYSLPVSAVFPNKVIEDVKLAIVAIYLDEDLNYFRGTGFFINSSGTIITAGHVIKNRPKLWALTYDGRKLELILAAFQKNDDLAVMFPKISESEISVFSHLKFDNTDNLAIGQRVMVVGNSLGGLWQILYANITNLRKKILVGNGYPTPKKFNSMVEYSVFTLKGFSGSPLVDENGDVIGVSIASSANPDENLSYAVGLTKIRSFIEEFYRNSLELIKNFNN